MTSLWRSSEKSSVTLIERPAAIEVLDRAEARLGARDLHEQVRLVDALVQLLRLLEVASRA
jgi:hypothetical protein